MITPAGKKRDQVSQGPLRHGGILNDIDMFKAAIGLNTEDAMVPEIESKDPDDLQRSMNDSKSRMNQDQNEIPGVDAGDPSAVPDPNAAAQASGLGQGHRDFATIASELSGFLQNSEVLTNDYVLIDQKRDQASNRWTFIIEPVRSAAPQQMQQKVSPQGPPIGEPMGGGGGGGGQQVQPPQPSIN